MRKALLILSLCLATVLASPTHAWTDHTLVGYAALQTLSDLQKTVKAETLTEFLEKEKQNIGPLLDEEEAWAQKTLPGYPVAPPSVRYSFQSSDITLTFLRAIRTNPTSHVDLYVQPSPGTVNGRKIRSWESISILKHNFVMLPFVEIQEGSRVTALEVIATACDEPDYGLDINLYEDSGTEFGNIYGYGKLPFGNPALEYSTEGPFHVGFFHEAKIVFWAAPFLKGTHAEARAHMYLTLSRFAFRRGHPYWGYRFAGWGLHYVQDLSQPYHARVLPSMSALQMIWINVLDKIGFHESKIRAIDHVSNTHKLLERFGYVRLRQGLLKKDKTDPLLVAMSDIKNDSKYPPWNDQYAREIITAETYAVAGETDQDVTAAFPEEMITDFASTKDTDPDYDLLNRSYALKKEARDQLDLRIQGLLKNTASHTRIYLKAASP